MMKFFNKIKFIFFSKSFTTIKIIKIKDSKYLMSLNWIKQYPSCTIKLSKNNHNQEAIFLYNSNNKIVREYAYWHASFKLYRKAFDKKYI